LGVADRVQAETALREKDPSRPWDPDPTDHTPSLRVLLQMALRIDAQGRVVRAPLSGDEHSSYAENLARCRLLLPESRVIVVGDSACVDCGSDHLHLPADLHQLGPGGALGLLRAFLGLSDRLLRGPIEASDATVVEAPPACAMMEDPWIRRIEGADLEALRPHLFSLRQHPDEAVRSALGRWLVLQGVRPVVAETLCGLEGLSWYRPPQDGPPGFVGRRHPG